MTKNDRNKSNIRCEHQSESSGTQITFTLEEVKRIHLVNERSNEVRPAVRLLIGPSSSGVVETNTGAPVRPPAAQERRPTNSTAISCGSGMGNKNQMKGCLRTGRSGAAGPSWVQRPSGSRVKVGM